MAYDVLHMFVSMCCRVRTTVLKSRNQLCLKQQRVDCTCKSVLCCLTPATVCMQGVHHDAGPAVPECVQY